MFDDIIAIIRPDTLGDYFIYIIFILSLIQTVVTPEKNNVVTNIAFVVIVCCIFDIIRGSQPNLLNIPEPWGFTDQGFLTFMIHIAMAVLPLVAAGMVRRRGREGALAVPVALLTGGFGILYAVGAFFAPQVFY